MMAQRLIVSWHTEPVALPPPLDDTRGIGSSMWQNSSRPVVCSHSFEISCPVSTHVSFRAFLTFPHPAIVHVLLPVEVSQRLQLVTLEANRHTPILAHFAIRSKRVCPNRPASRRPAQAVAEVAADEASCAYDLRQRP